MFYPLPTPPDEKVDKPMKNHEDGNKYKLNPREELDIDNIEVYWCCGFM